MDEEWEELDENAMEECMVLATQLCSEQPPHSNAATEAQSSAQRFKPRNCMNLKEDSGVQSGVIINGSLGSVNDSGMGRSRSNNFNPLISNSSSTSHSSISNTRDSLSELATSSSTVPQKKEPPQNSYRSRFSCFSTNGNNGDWNKSSLTRKPSSSGRSFVPLVTNAKGSLLEAKNLGESNSANNGSEGNGHMLHKAQEENKKLNERIITMQGEISLLRSELKRKETSLEAERLDHCAAIELAEKRGREKVAKQALEAQSKLKDKEALLDKLQGELHFKKREVEELMRHCHQLEQQPELSQTPGPANKRPRIERTSADTSILSRFDFGVRGAATVSSVEVQTESLELEKVQRRRLNVALPKGRICQTRNIATLLSTCALSSTSPLASDISASSCGSSNTWSLPPEWLVLISQTLRKNDNNVEEKLVTLAVERLLQTHTTISDDTVDHRRLTQISGDLTEWYENQVGPAIQILSYFKSSSESRTVKAIAAHLPPLNFKNNVVNSRMRMKLLEAALMVVKNLKCHMERTDCEALSSLLKKCCGSIESGSEAKILLRLASTLIPHNQLCFSSGTCLIGQLCKKVKKLCVADLETLKILLDLTWKVVKVAPASSCLTFPCPCSSQLLGTFLWHIYQVLESSCLSANKKKLCSAVVSCIQVLHDWSVFDPDWWDKVSNFPHYPVVMITLATKASNINFDKNTVDLLCDLYEFEEGTFER